MCLSTRSQHLFLPAHSIQAALSDLGCTGGSSLFVIPGPITVELSTWYPIDVQKCPTGTKPASLHGGIIPEAAATVKACRAITGSDLVWGDSGTTEGGTAWKLSDTEPATLLYGFNRKCCQWNMTGMGECALDANQQVRRDPPYRCRDSVHTLMRD